MENRLFGEHANDVMTHNLMKVSGSPTRDEEYSNQIVTELAPVAVLQESHSDLTTLISPDFIKSEDSHNESEKDLSKDSDDLGKFMVDVISEFVWVQHDFIKFIQKKFIF